MGFLDIGPMELLVIFMVILIVLGPKRIPEIAMKLGRMVRALRKVTFDFTTAVTKEMEGEKKEHSSEPEENSGRKTKKSSAVVKKGPRLKGD